LNRSRVDVTLGFDALHDLRSKTQFTKRHESM
jgi:hypothetical protein